MAKVITKFAYVFYYIIFYIVWALLALMLFPILKKIFDEYAFALIVTVIKLLIWTIPAILLIKYYESDMYISLNQMIHTKIKWFKYILILAGFFIYHLIIAYFYFKEIRVNSGFTLISLINTVLFVGITEEAVFRGWLLNATLKRLKYWHAVLLNAALFLLIHFPGWIYGGMFAHVTKIFLNCLGVFFLGIVFSWTFIKSKNIFVPIVLHMSWNLFYIIFFGG